MVRTDGALPWNNDGARPVERPSAAGGGVGGGGTWLAVAAGELDSGEGVVGPG